MSLKHHIIPPFFERAQELIHGLFSAMTMDHGMCVVYFDTPQVLLKALAILKNHPDTAFTQLTDITAVDYPARLKRFEMVYQFLSMLHNQRIRFKLNISEDEAIPSITALFCAANWYEREVYDLYGIKFSHHPDLRRILSDYNFEGHPLRKDFPLSGYYEVRYDHTHKHVVYEPVVFPQAFRQFDYLSPWEGMLDAAVEGYAHEKHSAHHYPILPGDEKARTKPRSKNGGAS